MGKLLFDTIKKIKPLDKNRMEEKEKELNSLLKTPQRTGKARKIGNSAGRN